MSRLPAILGAGQQYLTALRGTKTVIDFADAFTAQGIELQFYSVTGELVGLIGSTYEKSNMVNLEIKEEREGGLKSFAFTVGRALDIPFFDGMEVRFTYNNVLWFNGYLVYTPGQDRRDVEFEFEGVGWIAETKKVTIKKLYENETLEDILIDLLETEIVPNTQIIYNTTKINPPNITVTKLELNKKKIDKALKTLLKIANYDYNDQQYTYGVDKYREFYFQPISNALELGLFEGKQYQNPNVENDGDIINTINIYRAIEDSNNTEFVTEVSDADSQDLNGIFTHDIVISDYVDLTTAVKIAQAIIEQFKDVVVKIEVEELKVEDEPFNIGFYAINNRLTQYVYTISEFEYLYSWTLNINNTIVEESTDRVLTKRKSFKITTAAGSNDEFMEFDIDDPVYFPNTFIMYVNQSLPGQFFAVRLFDEDGNFEDVGVKTTQVETDLFRTTLAGDFRVTLDGKSRITLQKSLITVTVADFAINIVDDFVRIELPITSLRNVAKVRITFITDDAVTMYFDRLDIGARNWRQNRLISESFKYSLANANFKCQATFGGQTANLIDDIKKLDEKSENILNIFEKEV